jgi:BolA protein
MSIQTLITDKLTNAFAPDHLQVINESHMHSVPADSETHFKVVVVSSAFTDKRNVARHQLIYGLLGEELEGPVHALALHTYTAGEWAERQALAPDSPDCLGGSKSP